METRNQILGKHQTFYFILLFIFIFLHTKHFKQWSDGHFRQHRQLWGGDRWEGLQKGGQSVRRPLSRGTRDNGGPG